MDEEGHEDGDKVDNVGVNGEEFDSDEAVLAVEEEEEAWNVTKERLLTPLLRRGSAEVCEGCSTIPSICAWLKSISSSVSVKFLSLRYQRCGIPPLLACNGTLV